MAKKRKKTKDKEAAAKDGNVILFTALSMILLAFFIVLNSIATLDQNRKLEALGSLVGSFGILPGGVLPDKGEKLLPHESPIVSEGEMFDDSMGSLEKYIVQYQLAKEIDFRYSGGDITIALSSEFLFREGTDKIRGEALALLNMVTKLVGTVESKVRIESYLDSKEAEKNGDNPWDFSLSRAIGIMYYMIRNGEILPGRFSVGGYGETKQKKEASGNLKRSTARVEITLLGDVDVRESKEEGTYRYKGFSFRLKGGEK